MRSLPVASLLSLVGVIVGVACGGDDDAPSTEALCGQICTRSAAAACANEDVEACDTNCVELVDANAKACKSELDALTNCFLSAKWTCDSEQEAEAKACATKFSAFAECAGENPSNPGVDGGSKDGGAKDGGAPKDGGTLKDGGVLTLSDGGGGTTTVADYCAGYCAKVVAPNCWNEVSLADCKSSCVSIVSIDVPACDVSFNAAASCWASATYACDDSGYSVAAACSAKETTWSQCLVDQGVINSPVDPVCQPSVADDTCTACLRSSCCEPFAACQNSANCTDYEDCYLSCTTPACDNACAAQYPQGEQLFGPYAVCFVDTCGDACLSRESVAPGPVPPGGSALHGLHRPR